MGSIKDIFVSLISNTKNQLLLAGASVIVVLFLLMHFNQKKLHEAEKRAEIAETNLAAAQDTIRTTKAKNGELEYDKKVYIASNIKELKALNDSLAKQVEITNGTTRVIANIGARVVHDTVFIPSTVYVTDSVISIRPHIDTTYSTGNYRALAFETVYKEKEGRAFSVLTEDKIGFTATVGIKQNEKKQYEIFVRPHYPNMEIGHLEGAIIEDNIFKKEYAKVKVPLVTIGGNIGLVPYTYDLNTRKSSFNFSRVGISLGLNFNLGAILK